MCGATPGRSRGEQLVDSRLDPAGFFHHLLPQQLGSPPISKQLRAVPGTRQLLLTDGWRGDEAGLRASLRVEDQDDARTPLLKLGLLTSSRIRVGIEPHVGTGFVALVGVANWISRIIDRRPIR